LFNTQRTTPSYAGSSSANVSILLIVKLTKSLFHPEKARDGHSP